MRLRYSISLIIPMLICSAAIGQVRHNPIATRSDTAAIPGTKVKVPTRKKLEITHGLHFQSVPAVLGDRVFDNTGNRWHTDANRLLDFQYAESIGNVKYIIEDIEPSDSLVTAGSGSVPDQPDLQWYNSHGTLPVYGTHGSSDKETQEYQEYLNDYIALIVDRAKTVTKPAAGLDSSVKIGTYWSENQVGYLLDYAKTPKSPNGTYDGWLRSSDFLWCQCAKTVAIGDAHWLDYTSGGFLYDRLVEPRRAYAGPIIAGVNIRYWQAGTGFGDFLTADQLLNLMNAAEAAGAQAISFSDFYKPAAYTSTGLWPLFVNTVDSSGSNDGTYEGGTFSTIAGPGPDNSSYAVAATFDGTSNYISLTTPIALTDAADWTITAWMQKDVATRGMILGNESSGAGYIRSTSDTTIDIRNDSSVSASFTVSALGTASDDWHFVMVSHDQSASEIHVFVDGVESSTGAVSIYGDISCDSIGRIPSAPPMHDGGLCAIGYYDSDLTTSAADVYDISRVITVRDYQLLNTYPSGSHADEAVELYLAE